MRKTKSLNDISEIFSSEKVFISPFSRESAEKLDEKRKIVPKLEAKRNSDEKNSSSNENDLDEGKTLKDPKVSKVNLGEEVSTNPR